MKKRKVAVALGLCLAVGLCGASLVACGGDDDGGDKGDGELVISTTEKSDYYLAGDSKSGLFEKTALGVWNGDGHASTKDQIPDSIALWKTNKANTYAITLDLYENDEFQILIAGDENNGWGGQMGADVIRPVPTETDPFGDKPGGGTNSNMFVRQDGNYTLVLHVDENKGNTVTYTRNSNAAPLATQYNYWVVGETLTHGNAMYNGLTKFTTDTNQTVYNVTVNLQENEKIAILGAAISAGNDGANIDQVTLKAGAAISAVPAAQAEEGEEGEGEAEAPAGPVYMYQAGDAGSYTITITETDEVDSATNSVTTKREINATKAALVNYEFKLRSSAGGDSFLNQNEYDFTLNGDGKYEITFTAAAANADVSGEGSGLSKIKVGDTFAIDVVKSGESLIGENKVKAQYNLRTDFLASWDKLTPSVSYGASHKVLAEGTYTITVDPNSFEVTITKEGDPAWAYAVYAHGSYAGAGWADNTTSGVATADATSAEIILTLKEGDEFGFRTYHASNSSKVGGQLDWASASATNVIADKLKGVNEDGVSGNFKVLADGKYKFTVTVDADGKITAIAAEEVAAEPAA